MLLSLISTAYVGCSLDFIDKLHSLENLVPSYQDEGVIDKKTWLAFLSDLEEKS